MEIFEVIHKSESSRCKKYLSDYIDVDGKIAFPVVIEENTYKTIVMAKNRKAVEDTFKETSYERGEYSERLFYDVEIKHLRSEEMQFEVLFEENRVSEVEKQKRIDTRDVRETNRFCSDEVQTRYEKLDDSGKEWMRTHRTYDDF
jgi:hypothetical protein